MHNRFYLKVEHSINKKINKIGWFSGYLAKSRAQLLIN